MGAMNNVRARYVGIQQGEWGTLLVKPKALDMESEEALEAARLTTDLGFERYIQIFRYVLPVAGPVQIALSNWDMKWYDRYWSKDYIRVDPVVEQMLRCDQPFDWQDVGPLSPAQRGFFGDAVKHGMADGVAGCLRFGADQAGFFSVSSPRPVDKAKKQDAMGRFMLLTSQLYCRVRSDLLAHYKIKPVEFTRLQLVALKLTMRGLSRAEAALQMGCTENNFAKHQEAIRRKLGETTNHGAVRRAIAMDLIRTCEVVHEPDEDEVT